MSARKQRIWGNFDRWAPILAADGEKSLHFARFALILLSNYASVKVGRKIGY